MRGRQLVVWALASVVLGCAPAPSPTPTMIPPITPPPMPADVVPWPDVVWSMVDGLAAGDPGFGEGAVAVTAGAEGFVAVGYRDIGDARDGLIWFSEDGQTWAAVDAPDLLGGVEMVDVSQGPLGFLALGIATVGDPLDRTDAVFLRSADGREWERLADVPSVEETFPAALSGGEEGVVAVGSDAEGTAVWHSTDGRTFERIRIDSAMSDAVTDPHAVDDGFVALGSANQAPVFLRTEDARSWTEAPIDSTPDMIASRLVPGRWGYVVQGVFAPVCQADAPCEERPIGWWSGDGAGWARLPDEDTPVGNGASIIVAAGAHGVLAIDGASAWESPDGWAWRPLPEPGDGTVAISDAVVEGDVIVAVGAAFSDDGVGRSAILVAVPAEG